MFAHKNLLPACLLSERVRVLRAAGRTVWEEVKVSDSQIRIQQATEIKAHPNRKDCLM